MIISIIQPCFIPWMGYFEQMAVADLFVYMDDVQYTKKDWRNTNQLLSPNGPKRIFVPVKKCARGTMLNNVFISTDSDWRTQLLSKVENWYRKAPFFDEIYGLLEKVIQDDYEKLVDLNYKLNDRISAYIGIETPVHHSSQVPRHSDNKMDRILEIVGFYGADVLYDGKAASTFIDTQYFRANKVEVIFQDYQHRPYSQLFGDGFVPYMSIIDLMMNKGKQSFEQIMYSPLPEEIRKKTNAVLSSL